MSEIHLAYGRGSVSLSFDDSQFQVLDGDLGDQKPLSDLEIGQALDQPINSRPLDEIIRPGQSVLIVVSDATRATGSAQVVNLLVRRLIQNGVSASDIAIIFATGIHRALTADEKSELLTPFIVQRIRTITHNANEHSHMVSLGTTERGTPIEINQELKEFDHVIVTSGIAFHYFAGFTGSRKSICPGLASATTIKATHMLALDFDTGGRRAGVGTGLLDGNAVHEECERIAKLVEPSFSISTIVDDRGRTVGVYSGHWRNAHRVGCDDYLSRHTVHIDAKRDLVIASCGGSPYDINLIQAHKALDMAAHACHDGGTIILLAECRDGLGRTDFLKWFVESNSLALGKKLREAYEVNGQTAWALLTKAERFRIYLVSNLPEEEVRKMRMIPASSIRDVSAVIDSSNGFIMPRGAALLPKLKAASTN